MLNFNIKDSKGNLIHTNLPAECKICIDGCSVTSRLTSCYINSKNRRHGKTMTSKGTTYICSDQKDLINSSRIFKEKLKIYSDFLPEIEEIKNNISSDLNQNTKRLLHNITSLNAHNIQELYALVPQEVLSHNFKSQHSIVKKYIIKNPKDAADTLMRVVKNTLSLKTEFSVFNRLFEKNPSLTFSNHNISKVILTAFHIFFQDFTDLGVHVNFEESKKFLRIDYESFYVALYSIIDNSVKYIHPHTNLNIKYEDNTDTYNIKFEMLSMKITDDEKDRLVEDGYSGYYAKSSKKNGHGIGLKRTVSLLELNSSSLKIHNNVDRKQRIFKDIPYETNVFEIIINKNNNKNLKNFEVTI